MLTYDVSYAFEVRDDCVDYTVAKTPFASLPPTEPFVETFAQGQVFGETSIQEFAVPHKFYKLSQLYSWRSISSITGFRAEWTVPDEYTGYEPIVQMFGSPVPAKYFVRKTFW